jgi:ribosome-binding factor A
MFPSFRAQLAFAEQMQGAAASTLRPLRRNELACVTGSRLGGDVRGTTARFRRARDIAPLARSRRVHGMTVLWEGCLMSHGSAPSQRMLRAGELIRHALSDVFMRGDTGDPELERLKFSVVEVQMSPDLKIATAFVRPLVAGEEKKVLYACTRNQSYIRGLLAPRLDMKFMPQLRFRTDTALEYASKIDDLLRKPEVARDLKEDD